MAPKKEIVNWVFKPINKSIFQRTETTLGRAKLFLYETLHSSVTRHNLHECFELLRVLPIDTSLDPYILFRFIFILIESNDTSSVNKNVIIYLESLLSKLDIVKPDAFIEFLAYFIRNNRLDDARELLAQRHRFMSYQTHRTLPFIDVNLRCYEFLLNYTEWSQRTTQQDVKFDVSIQGWVVNAIDQLQRITSNHEYFVMCVLRVLLHYKFHKKAYLFVSEFQRNNPDNICAQLLLFNLLKRLQEDKKPVINSSGSIPMVCDTKLVELNQNRISELEEINNFSSNMEKERFDDKKYPIVEDKKNILNNLRNLDPAREEILELGAKYCNEIEILQDVMDSLELIDEIKNKYRWRTLFTILESMVSGNDSIVVDKARNLWITRYQKFWEPVDFFAIIGDSFSRSSLATVKKVLHILNNDFKQ